jgi:hypothetical protein
MAAIPESVSGALGISPHFLVLFILDLYSKTEEKYGLSMLSEKNLLANLE